MKKMFSSLALCTVLIALCESSEAQPKKMARIGFFWASRGPEPNTRVGIHQGLRELGYIEGKNLTIVYGYAGGKFERLPVLAAELVDQKVDVIITGGSTATRAAKEATATIPIVMIQDNDPVGNGFVSSLARPGGNITGLSTLRPAGSRATQSARAATATIPIVMAQEPDPVANGFVASLARPGGNITGLSILSPELSGKRLELLQEIVPKLFLVAVFGTSTSAEDIKSLEEIKSAAATLKVQVQYLDIRTSKDIEPGFRAANRERADAALWAVSGSVFRPHRTQVVELAIKNRLPVIYNSEESVQAGGLIAYGVNGDDLYRRAATYVDKILKGTKPGDLPIEQPTKFELAINLKTAKQIGLTIPPNVLARADRVIK